MRWAEITIRTTEEASEAISEMLAQAGCDGIAVTDPYEFRNTVENDPLSYADDGTYKSYGSDVVIKSYFAELDDGFVRMGAKNEEFFNPEGIGTIYGNISGKTMKTEDAVEFIKSRLADIGEFLPVGQGFEGLKYVKDEDWANNWKKYYKEFKISDRVAVCPSWLDPDSIEAEHKIILDPGSAFGTGTHETTSMCIKALEKDLGGTYNPSRYPIKVLDVGTGTGILAMAAVLLGADEALGIDIDDEAVRVANENIIKNGLEGRISIRSGNLVDGIDYDPDIIVANLMADLVVTLSPAAAAQLMPGGLYITSGILDIKEETVKKAIEDAGFDIIDVLADGEWRAIAAVRR